MQSILQLRRMRQSLARNVNPERAGHLTIETDSDPTRTAENKPTHLPDGIEVQAIKTHEGDSSLVFVVSWAGQADPMNPHNWSKFKRVICTLLVSFICFICMMASSIDAAIAPQAAQEFGVSPVVESLATAMFLFGSGVGSLFTGPFSETFGRNPVYLGTLMLFMIWVMASGLSPNIGAQLAFRFLAGIFGCAPLTCAGGTTSDLWNGLEKTYAFPLFAIPAFGGSMLGPAIGSYFGTPDLPSWRWTEWLTLILAGLVMVLVGLFLPETHPATLLHWKAKQLREMTKDDRYVSQAEIAKVTLCHRMKIALTRPWTLAGEPIVIFVTVYLTVIWAVLFTFLDGYNFIFSVKYGLSQAGTMVIFIAMYVGVLLAIPLVPLVYMWTKKDMEKSKDSVKVRAETRLWYVMLGGSWAIPVSLFWLAWTDYHSINIWSPIVSTSLFGFGLITVFMSGYMYIIDAYETMSPSGLTFATVVRFLVSGGLTVAGIPFYENVGTHWTLTIMAVIGLLIAPVPFVLYRYGPWVRKHSKHAVNKD